ncbi:MAG: response regulator transcription factor [Armatimonadetes bacterium]|nr:response regulator transcription factor [Armatimonadota bacterium]
MAQTLRTRLEESGFAVWIASTGAEGLEHLRQISPDVLVLDLVLPDMDGFDVCAEVRRQSTAPVLIASGRTAEADRVCGLELGADDYLCKPYAVEELLCRLRTVLARWHRHLGIQPVPEDRSVRVGPLVIDAARHEVEKRGTRIALTPKEFELLWALAREPNRTVSARRLLWEVWGYDERVKTRTLDVHIGRLRRKIEDDPHNPRLIVTVPSVGYRLCAPEEARTSVVE